MVLHASAFILIAVSRSRSQTYFEVSHMENPFVRGAEGVLNLSLITHYAPCIHHSHELNLIV